VLAARSKLLCGYRRDDITAPLVCEVQLAGGYDPGNIQYNWYTGYDGGTYFQPQGEPPEKRYGLATLEGEGEIDLVAIPDLAGQVPLQDRTTTGEEPHIAAIRHVLYHAATCGDRFALLDTPAGLRPSQAILMSQQLAEPLTAKFGALYYPWLGILKDQLPGLVPPSGFIAGVMAHADQQGGPGRAPANFPLKDVIDLELVLDQADQNELNPAGVNCIRKLEKPAVELWGARTLSIDPQSCYVNTRRLVIAVKKMLGRALNWTVFEPNGPALWERIRTSLRSQMQALLAGGATAAPNGDQSFFVKCDAETNPPEVSNAGQVMAVVGIAPAAPAEFIILNVSRMPGGVSVSENG
jgi:phage tail sheath protein FI